MSMKAQGVDKLIAKFSAIPKRVGSEVGSELRDIGGDLKDESQSRVSVVTGALRDSVYVQTDSSGEKVSVEVGAQGLPYIIPNHEGMWRNLGGKYGPHTMTYPSGGESKWLEKPFLEGAPSYKKRVRDAVQRGVRG